MEINSQVTCMTAGCRFKVEFSNLLFYLNVPASRLLVTRISDFYLVTLYHLVPLKWVLVDNSVYVFSTYLHLWMTPRDQFRQQEEQFRQQEQ